MVDIFDHFPSFTGCDKLFLSQICYELETRMVQPGTILIREGQA